MRTDKASIYRRELEKAHEDGLSFPEAERRAEAEADRVYWELVDRGRQEAKDR